MKLPANIEDITEKLKAGILFRKIPSHLQHAYAAGFFNMMTIECIESNRPGVLNNIMGN